MKSNNSSVKLSPTYKIKESCLFRVVGRSKLQILNLEKRLRYLTEDLGAYIFLLLDRGRSIDDIVSHVNSEFAGHSIAQDQIEEFLQSLVELGLIERIRKKENPCLERRWFQSQDIKLNLLSLRVINEQAAWAAAGCTGDMGCSST